LLVALDLDKEFKVEVDTSNFVIGEILSIKYKDNMWRLVAYISKLLNNTERNQETGIGEKEVIRGKEN